MLDTFHRVNRMSFYEKNKNRMSNASLFLCFEHSANDLSRFSMASSHPAPFLQLSLSLNCTKSSGDVARRWTVKMTISSHTILLSFHSIPSSSVISFAFHITKMTFSCFPIAIDCYFSNATHFSFYLRFIIIIIIFCLFISYFAMHSVSSILELS